MHGVRVREGLPSVSLTIGLTMKGKAAEKVEERVIEWKNESKVKKDRSLGRKVKSWI